MRFAFLDASGDTGFKIGRGSSEWFVMALLLVDDPLPLQSAIDALRVDLGFPSATEFKFNKASPAIKERFLRLIRAHDVTIRGMVLSKLLLVGRPEAASIGDLYRFGARLTLMQHRDVLAETSLVVDERATSRKAQREINTYLRQAANTGSAQRALRQISHARTTSSKRRT